MKKKMLAAVLCGSALLLTACGESDVMVLTPNGDAVIRDNGSSSGGAQTSGNKSGTSGADTNADASNDKSDDSSASKTDDASGGTASGGSGSSSGLLSVGFAQVGSESGWRLAQTASMKETFTEANGYSFDFVDCNNDQKAQIDTISKFIQDKKDYIVIDPIVEDGYDDVMKQAQDAGIPVIVVDRETNADESLYTCWVGSDFTQEGRYAGEWLEQYLEDSGRAEEEINMVTILGSDGASAMTGRTAGMNEVVEKHSNWKMLDMQSGDFTEDGGLAVMTAFLKQYDDIDVVVCQNDDEAFGAIQAIEAAGKTCGPNGDIIMISFDATKNAFEQMVAGKIHVDVECNPLEGPFVAELIQKIEAGESVDKVQYMEEGVFKAEDAADIIDSRVY